MSFSELDSHLKGELELLTKYTMQLGWSRDNKSRTKTVLRGFETIITENDNVNMFGTEYYYSPNRAYVSTEKLNGLRSYPSYVSDDITMFIYNKKPNWTDSYVRSKARGLVVGVRFPHAHAKIFELSNRNKYTTNHFSEYTNNLFCDYVIDSFNIFGLGTDHRVITSHINGLLDDLSRVVMNSSTSTGFIPTSNGINALLNSPYRKLKVWQELQLYRLFLQGLSYIEILPSSKVSQEELRYFTNWVNDITYRCNLTFLEDEEEVYSKLTNLHVLDAYASLIKGFVRQDVYAIENQII